jgi:hypothetical protein
MAKPRNDKTASSEQKAEQKAQSRQTDTNPDMVSQVLTSTTSGSNRTNSRRDRAQPSSRSNPPDSANQFETLTPLDDSVDQDSNPYGNGSNYSGITTEQLAQVLASMQQRQMELQQEFFMNMMNHKSLPSNSLSRPLTLNERTSIQFVNRLVTIPTWNRTQDPFVYIRDAVKTVRANSQDFNTARETIAMANLTYQHELRAAFEEIYNDGLQTGSTDFNNDEYFIELQRAFVKLLDRPQFQEKRLEKFTFPLLDTSPSSFEKLTDEYCEASLSVPEFCCCLKDRIRFYLKALAQQPKVKLLMVKSVRKLLRLIPMMKTGRISFRNVKPESKIKMKTLV